MVETAKKQETAVLVAVLTKKQSDEKAEEYLDELEFLAATAGIKTLKRFKQRLERPDSRTFVGSGKLQDINTFVAAEQPDWVIFDDELSASQTRNLDKILNSGKSLNGEKLPDVKILDRSLLILQIFLLRAKSAQSRMQVQLAQYQYLLPRLTRMWTHLERQRGGTGTRGGAGEKEIETDRRLFRSKIAQLKTKLVELEKQTTVQRQTRDGMVRVALCGYTNVGKSTLMRLLSKADVFAEDKLFATVDSTVRKIVFENIPFLLSDTVGFIRKLPTTLIESFKSTLAEITEADILMHVIDIAHAGFEEQMEVVHKTLAEIGAADKTILLVFNKIDKYQNPDADDLSEKRPPTIDELKEMYIGKLPKAVFISATNKQNIDQLRALMIEEVKKVYFKTQ